MSYGEMEMWVSLKERDDREQKVQQFLDQERVALIEFASFDAIDELLDLDRISSEDVIVIFHG
jgi:4-alpha-glucanotransferase